MPILNVDYSDLDFDEMASLIGLKPKHIPILVGSFLEETVSILEALSNAVESNDFDSIKAHAHSIKGSAGNLKFTEVYEMSREMELAASGSNTDFDYKSYLTAISSAIATIPN